MSEDLTLGIIQINDLNHEPIYTLENPWLNNTRYISCIPGGAYNCVVHDSKRFPMSYKLIGVPDRSAILIHPGNIEDDTEGCILLGLSTGKYKNKPAVLNSKAAVGYLRSLVGGEFILNIK